MAKNLLFKIEAFPVQGRQFFSDKHAWLNQNLFLFITAIRQLLKNCKLFLKIKRSLFKINVFFHGFS